MEGEQDGARDTSTFGEVNSRVGWGNSISWPLTRDSLSRQENLETRDVGAVKDVAMNLYLRL